MRNYVIGIDLGGTKISTALSDFQGNILNNVVVKTKADEGQIAVLNRIISTIELVIDKEGISIDEIEAIGIGSPGPLNVRTGVIIETPNLPFKNFNVKKSIEDKFKVSVYLDNDANVATIGEFMFGAGRGKKNLVFMTVSTGIGGGAIINGNIYRGSTFNALEIGHTTINPKGPKCNCGNIGCLEVLASGTAIGKRGQEVAESEVKTSLKNYNKITSYEVFLEAGKGDKEAKKIRDKALNYLGIGVANVVSIFDLEMVIIGGGVTQVGDILFERVRKVVNERCFKVMSDNCDIVPAALGTSAGVVGAAALAILESKNH